MRIGRSKSEKVPNLGTLELAVLKQLWQVPGDIDARTMLERLPERSISLSTVQATLERLSRKGIAFREKHSRAYFYRAAVTREQLIARLFGDVMRRLAEGELEPAISGFIDLIGDSDPKLLEQLEADARRRRTGR
jgi:BlaI family transcriptional regulator, penicillinase repressor